MRTIYVGDLHGKVEVAKAVLKNKHDKIVFVGDYLDSYDQSIPDQIETLKAVLEAAQSEPDRVIALRGNHEWSYLYPDFCACSGFKQATLTHVTPLRGLMLANLKDSYADEDADVLVTHAGVNQLWLDMLGIDIVQAMTVDGDDWSMAGRARGGRHNYGGPIWCDYWAEFKPVEGVKQVFGHTQYRPVDGERGVVTQDNLNFNIDCLDTSDDVLVWSPHLGLYAISYKDL